MFSAIKEYLGFQGEKYIAVEKAGDLAPMMLEWKTKGQAARKEFTSLAESFQQQHPEFQLERVSQWMNQAQVLRPHFWVYLTKQGEEFGSQFALRLYGTREDFGVSVEVSFVERKKADNSLIRQNQVLTVPACPEVYYLAQEGTESRIYESTESNRLLLQEKVASGQVRKVLVKKDISLDKKRSQGELVGEIIQAISLLEPYYLTTKKEI